MKRISLIIFAVALLGELVLFLVQPVSTKFVYNGKQPETGNGLSGRYADRDLVTDNEAQANLNAKFAIIIGTTVLIGFFIHKALPEEES